MNMHVRNTVVFLPKAILCSQKSAKCNADFKECEFSRQSLRFLWFFILIFIIEPTLLHDHDALMSTLDATFLIHIHNTFTVGQKADVPFLSKFYPIATKLNDRYI